VVPTEYTHVFASFYLPSTKSATDVLAAVISPAYGGPEFVQECHDNGIKVILSVGGATELPYSASYFEENEPIQLARDVAAMVIANDLGKPDSLP
jgi:hypothetical protein